jgi:hypothetical protein
MVVPISAIPGFKDSQPFGDSVSAYESTGCISIGCKDSHQTTFGLFILLPGACAAIAASLIGKPLLDIGPNQRISRPALRGAVIGSLGLALFAPLFSTLYVLTEPSTEHWNVFGLTILVLLGAMVAVWWLVALTGAVVAFLVHRLALSVTETEMGSGGRKR